MGGSLRPPAYTQPVRPIRKFRVWFHHLPLASKSLILFGGAAGAIIAIALTLPLIRMNALVREQETTLARSLLAVARELPADSEAILAGARVQSLEGTTLAREAERDRFVRGALRAFERDPGLIEYVSGDWDGTSRTHLYASVTRGPGGEIASVETVRRRADRAAWLLIINVLYVIAAGSVVLAVALVVFAIITGRLILKPVESLRQTAESVRDGHLDTRSRIRTGDEFEELADAFNLMLSEIERGQGQLRAINSAMDDRLTELSEANVTLDATARLKGEFLASVSHELRTPLNSIIGFAELLLEIAKREREEAAGGDLPPTSLAKRERYLENIVNAGRSLLQLIESLLEMAKIEAGKVEVQIDRTDVAQICRGLTGLVEPQARRRSVRLIQQIDPDLPSVRTDGRKLQQIVFNLLSNAVKFAGAGGRSPEVTVRAERLPPATDRGESVRVSVIDNGPGIERDDQARVFERFRQLDSGHTRGASGTGLGLSIVAELSRLLHADVQLVSEPGQGAMFSVVVPIEPPEPATPSDEAQREPAGTPTAEG